MSWEVGALVALQMDPRLLRAAVVLYDLLVRLFEQGAYCDPEQGFLYDVQLLLRVTIYRPETFRQVEDKSDKTVQKAEKAAYDIICNDQFHSDVRQYSVQILMQLYNYGQYLSSELLRRFAAAFDDILLTAGHYGLQNQLVWLLDEYAKRDTACRVKLTELERKYGKLEDDYASSVPNGPVRKSPRKMLFSFNGHDPKAQVVSVKPLAQSIFGTKVERESTADYGHGWFDFNLRTHDIQLDVRRHHHTLPCPLPACKHRPQIAKIPRASYIHTYIHAYIHTYIHTYPRERRSHFAQVSLEPHACRHTYIHTRMHTYMHTRGRDIHLTALTCSAPLLIQPHLLPTSTPASNSAASLLSVSPFLL